MLNLNAGAMSTSKYIKSDDLPKPVKVTIADLKQEDVSMENEPPAMKYVLYFHGKQKGLVLNQTNINRIASQHGLSTLGWQDKEITLYHDPNVEYGGKMVGGVRVYVPDAASQAAALAAMAAKPEAAKSVEPTPPPAGIGALHQAPEFDDDIPF